MLNANQRTPAGQIEAVKNAVPVARRQLTQWQTKGGQQRALHVHQLCSFTCTVQWLRGITFQLILDLAT